MKYLKNLGLFFAVVVALSGCGVVPAMYVAMGVKQYQRGQGRSEEVDFAYAKERVVVGVTTKADITKNLGEPNLITQDTNEVWKYEHREVLGLGSASQGDFTQVFVVFKNDDLVAAISGSELKQKKEVKFAKGDLRLLPFMSGQTRGMLTPQEKLKADNAEAPAAAQPEQPTPAVDPVANPPAPAVKKAVAKPKGQKTGQAASTLM